MFVVVEVGVLVFEVFEGCGVNVDVGVFGFFVGGLGSEDGWN